MLTLWYKREGGKTMSGLRDSVTIACNHKVPVFFTESISYLGLPWRADIEIYVGMVNWQWYYQVKDYLVKNAYGDYWRLIFFTSVSSNTNIWKMEILTYVNGIPGLWFGPTEWIKELWTLSQNLAVQIQISCVGT